MVAEPKIKNVWAGFTSVLIESNSSLFPPFVRIFWAGVNTAIALGWAKAEEVVSVRSQTNSGPVEWINQWMDDHKHMCGFVYSFWFTCKKGSVIANYIKQTKNNNTVFGPDQSKWTSGLSWWEYTLNVHSSTTEWLFSVLISLLNC